MLIRSPIQRGVALAAAALLLSTGGVALALEPGQSAPAFSLPSLTGGGEISLDAYRGKVVYLDFWASWCGPCAASLPMIDKLRGEFPPDRFQVVAVNLDQDPMKGVSFLQKVPVGYPSGSDPEGYMPQDYGVETMPTSFLIDQKGVVRYVHPGFRKKDINELRGRIRALLGGGA